MTNGRINRRYWTPAAAAAAYLYLDEATVRDWCRRVERGEVTKIRQARRDEKGRWYVSIAEIAALAVNSGLVKLHTDTESLRLRQTKP